MTKANLYMAGQKQLPFSGELIIDNFAGGGGASTGIELAIGRSVDIAINHDQEALSMHAINHPKTTHYCESVWDVNPAEITDNQPVGLVWLSPDCKHFSKAKGGKPVEKNIRGLAWVAVRWAATVKPRVIMLENVEEFTTWGPLINDGDGNMRPCPKRKGKEFKSFVNALNRHGYEVEWRELRGSDFGAPTIRKRLFLIARRDGRPIVWPQPTHGDPKLPGFNARRMKPWRTAAECIDWDISCPSIFDRTKPLADATCRRIAKGLVRYVINAAKPFIVKNNFGSKPFQGAYEPLHTVTTQSNRFSLVTAFLAKHYGGVVGYPVDRDPLHTITSSDHHSLVTANLIHMGHGEGKDGGKRFSHGIRDAEMPLNTITASGAAAGLVTSNLIKLRGDNVGQSNEEPLRTISAQGTHFAEVRSFLIKYYGADQDPRLEEPMHTVTARDRFGLVTVAGQKFSIADIGMRMLQPRELFRAQGFPESYIIDHGLLPSGDKVKLTKTAQVRMCGNSVCPPMAKALVEANFKHEAIYMEKSA